MAITLRTLAVVSNLPTTIDNPVYTPATAKAAIIKNMMFYNKTASPVTINATLRTSGGVQIYLWPTNVQVAAAGRVVISEEITMSYVNSTGDKLQIWAGTANAIDLIINGMERDI